MTATFVSGASGYLALRLVKELILNGDSVVGSVRTEAAGQKLKRLLESDKFSYEIVEDIQSEGAFDKALKNHPEITVFLHTASPLPTPGRNPETDILVPAINGTLNALKAIKAFGPQIKRVVITSSIAALSSPFTKPAVLNEESWSDITWEQAKETPRTAYYGSKAFSEKAAWEFVENEKPNFSLTTVNPSFVFGPQAFDEDVTPVLRSTGEFVNIILKLGPNDELPPFEGGFIDIGDVAKAHIAAFEKESTKNKRLLLSQGHFDSQGILDVLRKNFPQLTQLPVGNPQAEAKPHAIHDNSETKKLLGFEFQPFEAVVVASVNQILAVNKK